MREAPRIVVMTTVKARIKTILQARGWSQRELAKKAGLSKNYVQTLMSGHTLRPSSEKLDKIAKAAGFRYDWVARGVEPKTPYELLEHASEEQTSLERAIIAARAVGMSEDAIHTVQSRDEPHSSDPGPLYWFHQIEAEACRLASTIRRSR